jgi:myo-inositol 2-dehydrogenase/D-chiro-inositol 1-dehydrogenase
MNFLILGDGPEEEAWASALLALPDHRLEATFPGFETLGDVPRTTDFEEAMATRGLDAVIVGGKIEERGEWLRRVAAAGLAAICLHPPGDDSEAYYQVALSRQETGAIVVPYLPTRLHPAIAELRRALASHEIGAFRALRHESSARPEDGELARHVFARMVDVVRSLLGEIEAVTATGDPPGESPDVNLVVQLRGSQARRAELRAWAGPAEPARLILMGESGTLTFEYDRQFQQHARLIARDASGSERLTECASWDPHAATLGVLAELMAGRDAHPDLNDGTRAMELAEATVRSLRRGRTVDLYYEQVSESGNFKSVMTSTGCMLLLGILGVLPLALAGPALGLDWTLYIAYAIPPLLIVFILLQSLRFAAKDIPAQEPKHPEETAKSS